MPSDHYKLFLIEIDPKWCAADFTLILKVSKMEHLQNFHVHSEHFFYPELQRKWILKYQWV